MRIVPEVSYLVIAMSVPPAELLYVESYAPRVVGYPVAKTVLPLYKNPKLSCVAV